MEQRSIDLTNIAPVSDDDIRLLIDCELVEIGGGTPAIILAGYQ